MYSHLCGCKVDLKGPMEGSYTQGTSYRLSPVTRLTTAAKNNILELSPSTIRPNRWTYRYTIASAELRCSQHCLHSRASCLRTVTLL